VSGLGDFVELADKEYRDEYMSSHVRAGICYQIQALRDQHHMTQEEFARKLGKPQTVVSRLENVERNRAGIQTLLDIACALDIALLVRFVDYPTFLDFTQDISPQALRVQPFEQSKETSARATAKSEPKEVGTGELMIKVLLAGEGQASRGAASSISDLVKSASTGVNALGEGFNSAVRALQCGAHRPWGQENGTRQFNDLSRPSNELLTGRAA
jgi:transcriptional regulator with XRE-family HTH domain